MKSTKIIICALFLFIEYSNAQQSIYVRKGGAVDYKSTVSNIDSMKISATNTFDIYKGGIIVYKTPVASTDSITFLPPSTEDTCLNRLNTCDWVFQYVDNFDDASSTSANDYGLNDNLSARHLYCDDWIDAQWIRKGGFSNPSTPVATNVQVNNVSYQNVLSFNTTFGALVLNKLIDSGSFGRYRISFDTNPYVGEQTSNVDWTSFMFDTSATKEGYVTKTNFGFQITSNGNVQIFQNGNSKTVIGIVPSAVVYSVVLDINSCSLIATINGVKLTAVLDEPLPASAYVYMGANTTVGVVSTFDNLVINTQYSKYSKRVQNYGYYWVDSNPYGTHFSEIADYTNFNFIESITTKTPNTKTNVLQVRWQFWGDNSGSLRSDWESQWKSLLATINANIGKIKALYIFDEPFWAVPISVADYNLVLNRVKTDLPDMPIAACFAYPTVNAVETDIANINSNLDLIGADQYVASIDFASITTLYNNLKVKRPTGNLMLVPQTCYLGTTTDADVAKINWRYYNMALNDPRVTTIFNFGLWTSAPTSNKAHPTSYYLPITLQVQRLIGKAITTY